MNRFIELLTKKQLGEMSDSERNELNSTLANNEHKLELSSQIDQIFNLPISFEKSIGKDEISGYVENVHRKIELRRTKPFKTKIYWIRVSAAAASIILMLLGVAFYFNKNLKNDDLITKSVPKNGLKSYAALPDGTKVWINSDTRFSYNNDFGKSGRDVYLDGEAYFEVVKNLEQPFIVHTKTMNVSVLGTTFNVRAYKDESTTQATLLEGAIEVTLRKENNRKILLKPLEKIIAPNNEKEPGTTSDKMDGMPIGIIVTPIKVSPIDSASLETRWIKNKMIFDQDKLVDIIPILEKFYNIKIDVVSSDLLGRRFSGKIEAESLPEVLESLKLALGLQFKLDKERVTIYR